MSRGAVNGFVDVRLVVLVVDSRSYASWVIGVDLFFCQAFVSLLSCVLEFRPVVTKMGGSRMRMVLRLARYWE